MNRFLIQPFASLKQKQPQGTAFSIQTVFGVVNPSVSAGSANATYSQVIVHGHKMENILTNEAFCCKAGSDLIRKIKSFTNKSAKSIYCIFTLT